MANDPGGDTRGVNEDVLSNKRAQDMKPLGKFRSFSRSDQIWVIAGLLVLMIVISVFLGDWNFGDPTE